MEAIPRDKSCNLETRQLFVCQMTEELETWKLNEQQQQLVDASGLGNLIHMAGLAINRSVLRAFCELWSKETNTARFHDFEMAPSLRDTANILGIPVIGRVVTTGAVLNKSGEQLFFQYLGRVPGCKDCRGSHVKLSWLHSKFSQLSKHPTDDEIVYSTRAYLLYLIGATLFPENDRGYVSPKYLPLLSDFEKVREYAWGAAALAHLYKALSAAVMSCARKRLFGSAALLMGWIYEYIPAMRPDTEDTPALAFPRVCRWMGSTISQPTKEVSDIKKAFSQLRVSDINWEPYKDMDSASIPSNCAAPDNVCFSRTWLISFNLKEIYVPDRYARQFGQEQHSLRDVPQFQHHHWSMSVDWSLEYASEIKHFEQLINAARCDHTTATATCGTTSEVFAPITTGHADASLGPNLVTLVENIKKELPTIARFLEQCALPIEVARSLARIHGLVGTSHLKEGDTAAVDARRGGGTTQAPQLTAPHRPATPRGPETAEVQEHVLPDEAVQNGNDVPVPERRDTPRKEQERVLPYEAMQDGDTLEPVPGRCDTPRKEARGGSEDGGEVEDVSGTGTPGKDVGAREGGVDGEDEDEDEHAGGREGRKRPRRHAEGEGGLRGGGGGLRRSSRRCVQVKRFRHRGGKGSESSDPIVL